MLPYLNDNRCSFYEFIILKRIFFEVVNEYDGRIIDMAVSLNDRVREIGIELFRTYAPVREYEKLKRRMLKLADTGSIRTRILKDDLFTLFTDTHNDDSDSMISSDRFIFALKHV